MEQKKIFITVLLWLEIIVCLRVLIFILPFWLNQYFSGNAGGMTLNDWFMVVLTITIFIHGLAALLCFKNFSKGRIFHYVGLLIVLGMTAAIYNLSTKVLGTCNPFFIIPSIGSIIIVTALTLIDRSPRIT